jgi:UDP-glucuronate decarboxylase
VVQALRGEPLSIYGDGRQTRSFCFVDDLVRGLIALMDSADEITGPINLGNPREFTMKELADNVRELTHSRSELIYRPLPDDDPRQRQPDITQARERLGWQPAVPLREGLTETISYFKSLLGL